jgi:hypothetical protein
MVGDHAVDGRAHRLLVRDVELEQRAPGGGEVGDGRGAPRRRVDRVAVAGQALGGGTADPRRAARDEHRP